jgi:2-amino-4-hydroxy-6-hydroxymethyldihydropteridine diphosphokinase
MNNGVYVLLGTNLGDRKTNLTHAKQHISSLVGDIVTQSSIYKTMAWGNVQQPDFYNQVIEISTTLSTEIALLIILRIEHNMGRVRAEKWCPRIIDIDILLWQDKIIKTDALTIPHPGLPQRSFTLIPLAEIASQFLHTENKKTIAQLLLECTDTLAVDKLEGKAL